MGNAALRDLAAIETVPYDSLSGASVAVDAHNWLYRYLTTTVKFTANGAYTRDGEEVPNLIGVVRGLPKLLEHELTPVFVFDGGTTGLKRDEVEAARLESRTQRLTPVIQETSRRLLDLLDVPVVEAPAEGEAQAAHMARQEAVDYVGTEDYDALLFGAPLTLRQLTSSGDPERMSLAATLDAHDLTWEQLVDVAVLVGTDFNEGLDGVGPATAVDLVHEHGDLWGALEARGDHIEAADLVRELFLDPNVTDAEYDPDVRPDVDGAREFVVEEWGVPVEEVEAGFERIETAVTQTGLDRWT